MTMRTHLICAVVGATLLATGCTEPPKQETKLDKEEVAKLEKGDKPGKGAPLGELPDGPVAKVGDVEIGQDAFLAIYNLKLQKYKDRDRKIPRSADRRYRRSITERLIYQEVLRQEVEKQAVSIDETELNKRKEQQRKGIRDWENHLKRRGESEDSLEAMIVAELQEKALLSKDGKLEVTDEEVDEEYEKVKPNYNKDKERVRARHILVSVGPRPKPAPGEKQPEPTEEQKKQWEDEALARAKEIHAEVTAEGADFGAIAEEKSDGPSARKGGDLGIFTAERMVKEFSDAAFGLEVGRVSEPIKTKFGFHIIKVDGKFPPGDLPKEALDDQIRERLANQKLHRGRRELKETLLETYEVKNHMSDHLGPDPRKKRRKKRKKGALKKGGNEGADKTPKPDSIGTAAGEPPGKKDGGKKDGGKTGDGDKGDGAKDGATPK